LRDIASSFGLNLSDDDLTSFRGLILPLLESYRIVERMAEPPLLPVKYPRSPGWRPAPEENPLNAWYWRCEINGADEGPLTGKTVAIKDNTCVAGVPMMNGSATLEGYIPEVDATIVTRILDAGGTILGKAVCEDLCFSGGSFTPYTGAVLNPRDITRQAGGSSCGSAALVAAGEVDLATGGDQGGAIRIPSCWSGIVGHKPTYGLVPYTGVFPIELTLDHAGPMGANVRDVAVMLEAIAGRDGLDPRQPAEVPTERYSQALTGNLNGVRVGIVNEGFGWEGLSEPEVDEVVRDAAHRVEKAGATVSDVSVPLHRQGIHIWNSVIIEGATELMVKGNAMGSNWKGFYTTSLLDNYHQGLRARANDLSETVKLVVLLGEYLHRNYGGRHYAKGQNLAHTLRAAYDRALGEVDVLVMPTLPLRPTVIPPPDVSREEYCARALEMIPNTAPFDVTGHPAISVPCHSAGSLPVGMMIIGRHFADGQVLRVAAAFEEQAGGFS
ncbi:MAG TPA: amidase, partial [Acidimicrobiia bacterium]|nr:amidase [Acidimicrobiia bacterium]